MKPEWKKRWIAALTRKNTKYRQCRGVLRTKRRDGSYAYCALGVLCDLVDPKGWDAEGRHHGSPCHPSKKVLSCTGLTQAQLFVIMSQNDGLKRSFKTIAKLVASL